MRSDIGCDGQLVARLELTGVDFAACRDSGCDPGGDPATEIGRADAA